MWRRKEGHLKKHIATAPGGDCVGWAKQKCSRRCCSVSEVAVMRGTPEKVLCSADDVVAECCRWYDSRDQRRGHTGEEHGVEYSCRAVQKCSQGARREERRVKVLSG